MGIFVNPNHTFAIRLKFRHKVDEYNQDVGIETLPRDAEGEDVKELVCWATGRDFETMSQILEASTIINAVTGKPILRASVLTPRILLTFFKRWDMVDEDTGQPIPINQDTIGPLHHTIATALARRWLALTSGKTPQ